MIEKCIISLLLLCAALTGISSPHQFSKDSTTVVITLDNRYDHHSSIDSIYIVFDRFDRRGAGVVKQVFYPVSNTVKVTVPKGKYYVNVICLGMYSHECFDKVVNARTDKEKYLSFKLEQSALFTPGLVSMPPDKIDPSNLLVTRYVSYKEKRNSGPIKFAIY